MGRPGKLVQLGLETSALDCRARGMSLDETVAHLNEMLAGGGVADTVSRSAVARYYASVGSASVAAAHAPQAASRNADLLRGVGTTMMEHHDRLRRWMEEVDREEGSNWPARLGASRELREYLRLIARIADSVYGAERIAIFQQAVADAIDEADPQTAARVRQNLRRHREIRRAELLGA